MRAVVGKRVPASEGRQRTTGRLKYVIDHSVPGMLHARVLRSTAAELQVEGNATFGVGQALMEEMAFDGGQISNANLGDYMIPSMLDIPSHISTHLVEDTSGEGQVHGLGEGGTPVVPPAIANAVAAACGVEIDTLPITTERVLRALKKT